jgi:hypothetical protein
MFVNTLKNPARVYMQQATYFLKDDRNLGKN